MPKAVKSHPAAENTGSAQVVPPEYANRWIAWTRDGRRIVADGATFKACEASAARAGFAPDQVTFDKIPPARRRPPGPA
jgi:hypothetical protein